MRDGRLTHSLQASRSPALGCAIVLVQISDPHLRTDDPVSAQALTAAVERINALGYGLTLGVHSRVDGQI